MAKSQNGLYHLYDVSAAINYILDINNSPYLRAIRLYELQIAILFGRKLNDRQRQKKEFPDRWLAISSDLLASACVCSAMKLLCYMHKTRRIGRNSQLDLLDDPDARDVLGRVLRTPAGLKKIATGHRPRVLDIKLKNRSRQQRRYAPLYDVSLRWEMIEGSKLKGGWTTSKRVFIPKAGTEAHDIIRRYYKGLRGLSTAQKYKDKGDFIAGFVWLRHFHGGVFRPREVEKASFARKLLAEANDVDGLRRIFGQYEFIKARLEGRSYKLLALDLAQPVPLIEVPILPLSEELREAIETL
ncbi:hypothetical protein [Methylobacterium aquaticum]|uniref:Uncharacterized protein n=1 Tax=Methylobacterium aquaticum TaxID=270351 RepID=A0A0C6FPU3_9HYPH|nr:hypothetical protein [Methylobacterium aquaticum]BAQ44685.1 hypothetical protein Maq22A_c06700 [Methylobacterium aquaticum]